MDYLLSTGEIIYIVSDITAGVFLTVLVIAIITHQGARRPGFSSLFGATMLILAGIFMRFFALMMGRLAADSTWTPVINSPLPRKADVFWIMGFILISTGIEAAVIHTIYINEGNDRGILRPVSILSCITTAAGILGFLFTGKINSFTVALLAQLLCFNYYLRESKHERASHQFWRASIVAMATSIIPLIFGSARATGLGLSLMLIILNEQYHERIGKELLENEATLAKSRLQLLTEQISPHYIFNSLQTVRDLCGNDPAKARDAVDAFSEYLRGNLESLTREDLIPFSRELEHARAYLDLEKIAGRRKFDVEYDLEAGDFMLPPLVMQPIVENAVQHGGRSATSGVLISIVTRETEDGVLIEVIDKPAGVSTTEEAADAPQSAKSSLKKQSIGLDNVRTRLAIQCGATLDIGSFGDGTKVKIRLPKPQKSATNPGL